MRDIKASISDEGRSVDAAAAVRVKPAAR